jgi:hypothetical protein
MVHNLMNEAAWVIEIKNKKNSSSEPKPNQLIADERPKTMFAQKTFEFR